jgi:hypothetical protein
MTAITTSTTENPSETELGEGETEPVEPTLSKDVIFHILQNERRRLVLKYLQGREDPIRMRDVAEQVSAWEHDTTVQQLTSKQRQRVYIPLYQNHLTKLDDEGIIDYNQSRGIVERKPLADELDPYLDAFDSSDDDEDDVTGRSVDSWGKYYLGVSALGTLVVSGKAFGMSLLSTLSGLVIGVLILAIFSLVTLAQIATTLLAEQE